MRRKSDYHSQHPTCLPPYTGLAPATCKTYANGLLLGCLGGEHPDRSKPSWQVQLQSSSTCSSEAQQSTTNTTKTPSPTAWFPAVIFLAAGLSQVHEVNHARGQPQGRHPLTTVNTFSSPNINKINMGFYTAQLPKVLTQPQHQFAAPHNNPGSSALERSFAISAPA